MLFCCFLILIGSCVDQSYFSDDDGSAGTDQGEDGTKNPAISDCPNIPCPPGWICNLGSCIRDLPCKTDNDCINDSFCLNGRCKPYESSKKKNDPMCKKGAFSAKQFMAPAIKCKWTSGPVYTTPIVADLDGDSKPEITFVSKNMLVAIESDTCAEVFSKKFHQTPTVSFNMPGSEKYHGPGLSVADLDGDKVPEIVGVRADRKIVVFDNKGNELAISPKPAKSAMNILPWAVATPLWDAVAVGNLDGKGNAEAVFAGMAVAYSGGKLTTVFNNLLEDAFGGQGGHAWGTIDAIADVDLDGKPEVLTGNRIFDGMTGADKTPAAVKKWVGGYVAVAQFDTTPEPEVVLISSMKNKPSVLRVFHPKSGKLVMGPILFDKMYGGSPVIADFDGDTEPEIGVAGYTGYTVFDQDCLKKPLPSYCQNEGIRWMKKSMDFSSGATGSSVFDFNGDGQAEVVYRDECWLRIYDGSTGKVLFAQYITSGTIVEQAVIVDVDNDNHADIVVPSARTSEVLPGGAPLPGYCKDEDELKIKRPANDTQGIFVLQDPKNRWVRCRSVWNQHTYHITNINDDLTVPSKEDPSWKKWNNYRQNVPMIDPQEAIDLTAKRAFKIDAVSMDCEKGWSLRAFVCNRGTATAKPGIPGTFYLGDPRKAGSKKICSTKTTIALAPGQCEMVACDLTTPPKGTIDLWFRAGDDGSDNDLVEECKENNNLLHLPGTTCQKTVN